MTQTETVLISGLEAIGWGAIHAGCQAFFGYPITPQSEIPEFMSRELPKLGRLFLQTEDEIAAAGMVYGAAMTGARVMTSTSGQLLIYSLTAFRTCGATGYCNGRFWPVRRASII